MNREEWVNDLVHHNEKRLGRITLVLGVIAWLVLLVGTFGGLLIALLVAFVFYVIAHSALIAYIRGNGVELSEDQFPDLHAQYAECCSRLRIAKPPKAYVLNGSGSINAFATRFLGHEFVVLYTDTVDAMSAHPDGVKFYIGHELGHIRMKHLQGHLLRWPVLWLPLLGAAYSRSRESTCDRHGLACSSSRLAAAQSLLALAAGPARWKTVDVGAYQRHQLPYAGGFWASFHELTAAYPWLTKRVARVMKNDAAMPRRKPLAYLLAAFVPYAGPQGGLFGALIMVYIVGVLAAIGIPAYQDYKGKASVAAALAEAQPVETALGEHYQRTGNVPDSLAAVGQPERLHDGSTLSLNAENMVVTVNLPQGELVLVPSADEQRRVTWTCTNGARLKPALLPASCRASPAS